MATEYGDIINREVVDAAVSMVLRLRGETPGMALESLVDQAVHHCFCTCAIDSEDVIEHGRSGMHAAIVDDVQRRVERLLQAAVVRPSGSRSSEPAPRGAR